MKYLSRFSISDRQWENIFIATSPVLWVYLIVMTVLLLLRKVLWNMSGLSNWWYIWFNLPKYIKANDIVYLQQLERYYAMMKENGGLNWMKDYQWKVAMKMIKEHRDSIKEMCYKETEKECKHNCAGQCRESC